MTTSRPTVLVTGATGNVGRHVVDHLARRGAMVKAGVRDPEGAQAQCAHANVEYVRFDFLDQATYAPALTDVTRLFLLRPPAIADVKPTLNSLVDVAAEQGANHVVFLSVAGAERAKFIPHAKVEQHLRESSIAWTFLRVGFFAQNLGDAYREDIVRNDQVVVPAGSGKVSFIDVRDVAEAAAQILVNGSMHGEAIEMAGPELITFDQVAKLLSHELGRDIAYVRSGVLRYLLHVHGQGDSWGHALVKAALHFGLRFGQGEGSSAPLTAILGREPNDLATYIRDHRGLWASDSLGNLD